MDTTESKFVQKSGPALAVLPDRRRRLCVIVSLGYNQYWSSGFMFFEVLWPGASEGLRKPLLLTHIHTVFRTYSRKVLIFLYLRVQGGEQDA